MTQARYDKDEIQQFALNLLLASGMELEKAKVVCEILVEGDLMGHTTHGLQMLIPYLKSIEAKTMTLSGTYSILRETPSH
ncbi:MAG: Ldh family oxidoreductase, partial [Limisphaerales bacterium]